MSENNEFWARLAEPFDPAIVKWRIGARTKDKARGMALAYVDARIVMDRLDQVAGPDRWCTEMVCTGDARAPVVICRMTVWPPEGAPVFKSDGAGATDVEGEKGAISDAFKRAAVHFGIGRYLYGLDSPWVELENEGQRIKKSEMAKLVGALTGQKPPARRRAETSGREKAKPNALLHEADPAALKKLWGKVFDLLKNIYGSKEKVEGLDKKLKFEPMDFALEKLGYRSQNQIRVGDVPAIEAALIEWHQIAVQDAKANESQEGDEPF